MSWSINTTGTAEEIGAAFDAQRDQCAGWGMIEAEQRDIDEARDLSMQLASKHGPLTVNASGHWINAYQGATEPARFGGMSMSIAPVAQPTVEEPTRAATAETFALPDTVESTGGGFTVSGVNIETGSAGAQTFEGVSTDVTDVPTAPV